MFISVENRKSKKGNIYSVVVLHVGEREFPISFDEAICARLSAGESYVCNDEGVFIEYNLERR